MNKAKEYNTMSFEDILRIKFLAQNLLQDFKNIDIEKKNTGYMTSN